VGQFVPHAADRWAQAVTAILDCPFDPKTVAKWARAIGVSEGALRDWCRVARCRPKSSLDFGRLLRAIVQSREHGWDPFNLLDVANERTMRNLLRRGGLPDILSSDDLQLTPDRFLLTQRFVTDSVALRSLAASVERRIIFNLPSAV
jgi:hypothetical protein